MSYPSQGTPIDNDFHPVDSDMSATDDHWGTQMAGDVLPMPGEKSMGSGQTGSAADYATGKAKDPKVKSIGMDTLKGWAGRQK